MENTNIQTMEEQKNTNASAFKKKLMVAGAVVTCLAFSAVSASAAEVVVPTIAIDASEATNSYLKMFAIIIGAIVSLASFLVYKALGGQFIGFLKGVFKSR